jgi:hypothetical protein
VDLDIHQRDMDFAEMVLHGEGFLVDFVAKNTALNETEGLGITLPHHNECMSHALPVKSR